VLIRFYIGKRHSPSSLPPVCRLACLVAGARAQSIAFLPLGARPRERVLVVYGPPPCRLPAAGLPTLPRRRSDPESEKQNINFFKPSNPHKIRLSGTSGKFF